MVRQKNSRGVEQSEGGGGLEKLKIADFLAKHESFLYLCKQ